MVLIVTCTIGLIVQAAVLTRSSILLQLVLITNIAADLGLITGHAGVTGFGATFLGPKVLVVVHIHSAAI